jgi:hypothetical protein
MQWSRVPPKGEEPPKRSAHSAAMVDSRYLMLFGGWDGAAELGDLVRYDIGECHARRAGATTPTRAHGAGREVQLTTEQA